jgi:hypothetical protein
MTDQTADSDFCELRVAGELDRHAAEALQLELRRLAKKHGLEITIRVEKAIPTEPSS